MSHIQEEKSLTPEIKKRYKAKARRHIKDFDKWQELIKNADLQSPIKEIKPIDAEEIVKINEKRIEIENYMKKL